MDSFISRFKNKIIISSILLVAFCLVTLTSIVAQGDSSLENIDSQQILYASNITFNKESYTPGENVTGTFDLSNTSNYVVSGVTYSVELVQIFEETYEYTDENSVSENLGVDQITDSFAISDLSGAINVNPGNETVQFSYQLPQSIPEGRIGLLIKMHTSSGFEAGYEFEEINITGPRVYYVHTNGQVLVSATQDSEKEIFQLFEGPRVDSDEFASIYVYINNEKNESFSLIPRLKIFSGNSTNATEVFSKTFETVTIPSGETEISYPLDLSFEPGVYTGVVEYFDAQGNSKSLPLEFRYIIDNNSLRAKISEVLYNSTNLVDEDLLVSVSYTEPPINFRKNADGTYKDKRVEYYLELNKNFDINEFVNGTSEEFNGVEPTYLSEGMSAEVRVINMKNNSLLATNKIDFIGSSEVAVGLGKIIDADQIFVEVDLLQNGEVVDSYSEIVAVETYQYKNIFDKLWHQYTSYILSALFLIVLIIIIVLVRRSNIDKNVGVASVAAIVMVASSIIIAQSAEAQRTTGFKTENAYLTSININSPKPPSVEIYEPGETINFNASFQFAYCTNDGYNLNARLSGPVKNSNDSFGGMGGWFKPNVGSKVGNLWNAKHIRYNASINKAMKAPRTPGTYKFKYDIVVVSGDWGKYESGVVRFKVSTDVCKNLPRVQEKVPAGMIAGRNSSGEPICLKPEVQTAAGLQCSASKNRLDVGESVTYTSRTVSGTPANFNWYKGRDTSASNLVKTENNKTVSTYTTSFNAPGIYHTTAVAFANGKSESCVVVVSVGDEYEDVPLEDETLEEYMQTEEYLYYTDPETGEKYELDRNAALGKINFDLEGGLTNNTCKANWSAENVLKCSLYRNNTKVKDLEFSGSEDLTPGTYQIRCIQAVDGAEIRSEMRTCTQNPDFREQ